MENELGVFDLKADDEITNFVAASQGSHVAENDINTLACANVDVMECENGSKDGAADAPLGIASADTASGEHISGPDDAFQPESMNHERNPFSELDNHDATSSFAEQEERVPCDEVPSNCVLANSPSNSERVNKKSDADRMNESSPSCPATDIADDDIDNDQSSDNYFSASETDIIDMAVDYVVYRGNHCTGCLITFSCGGIKISGMLAHEDEGTFVFERPIEDIIRIESQHLQRFGNVAVKLHVLSKDVAQVTDAYGVEQLEFAVVEPNWSGKLEELASLNVKYLALSEVVCDSDLTMNEGDLFQRRPYFPVFEAVEDVIYPKEDSDAVCISKRDFDLLQPETFVNDTIIDFYIKYLKNQIPPEEKHRFHFFNSFFFRKLADLDKDRSSAADGRAAFLRVQKWTRKVDIFGKDYVFIPVNFNLHWSLLVLCHPGEAFGFNDEDARKSLRVPCVLHMDSIKGTHAGLKNLVQSYLWEEWKARNKETSEELSLKFLNLRFVSLELPQQENSYDCGLFLLHYLELFLAEAPLNFSPFKINEFSKFLNVDWFSPAEPYLKRTVIQRLISALVENRTHEHSSVNCNDKPELSFLVPDKKERAHLVSESCVQAAAFQGNLPGCDVSRGIEMTLLEASSMRNSDSVNDSGMVLRELFEPGVPTGSLLAQCSSFEQSSYCLNGAMSQQIEQDGAETGDQFMYFASGDSIFQQISGMPSQADSIPYASRGFGTNPSWNTGISMEEEDDVSSIETSECASDDSDIGIIEDISILKNLSQKDKSIRQRSLSIENEECPAVSIASGSGEMLQNFAIRGTEDLDPMHDITENGLMTLCQEVLNIDTRMVESGSHFKVSMNSECADVQVAGDDTQTMDGIVTAALDATQLINDDAMAKSDERQPTDDDMMANSDDKLCNDSDDRQPANDNAMAYSDETPADDNMRASSDEKQPTDDNTMARSDEKQAVDNNSASNSDEKQNDDNAMENLENQDNPDNRQISCNNVISESDANQRIGDSEMHESDEKQTITGSTVLELDKKQTINGTAVLESDKKQTINGTAVLESDENQTINGTTVLKSDELQITNGNAITESDEKQMLVVGNEIAESGKKQGRDESAMIELDEEQQSAKRHKVTSLLHEGDGENNGRLSEDPHV